jgi:hypothetical protein
MLPHHSGALRCEHARSCPLDCCKVGQSGKENDSIPRHSGATRSVEPGIHTPDRGYGFGLAQRAPRNDDPREFQRKQRTRVD